MTSTLRQTWSHQPPAIQFLAEHRYGLLCAAMGCGKSFIGISALRNSMSARDASLIICPHAVRAVWRGQFSQHGQDQFDVLVLDVDGVKNKQQRLMEALNRLPARGRPLIVVVNYDVVFRTGLVELLTATKWNTVVLDEIHKIKSPSVKAKQSHACWHIGKKADRRIGLTGTLMPHSPMDVFAQYRFLDERIFGRYITHFRNSYCVMNQYIPQKVDKWINQEEMSRKINLIRHSISKDVLVLPPLQEIEIECPLEPRGMRAYQQMKKQAIAEIKQQIAGLAGETEELVRNVVASNGAVQFLRLLQLAQGYSTDDRGEDVETDTAKRKVLLELLEEANEPVCVYGWFRHDLKIVEDCCRILGLRYGEISGSKKDLTPHGKMPDDIDVEGVQCKSGSSGIDLTRSRIGIVLNSGTMSPGDYDQMLARQYRPGQTRDCVYYHLVTPGTVDIGVRKARVEKRDVIAQILDMILEEEVF